MEASKGTGEGVVGEAIAGSGRVRIKGKCNQEQSGVLPLLLNPLSTGLKRESERRRNYYWIKPLEEKVQAEF